MGSSPFLVRGARGIAVNVGLMSPPSPSPNRCFDEGGYSCTFFYIKRKTFLTKKKKKNLYIDPKKCKIFTILKNNERI